MAEDTHTPASEAPAAAAAAAAEVVVTPAEEEKTAVKEAAAPAPPPPAPEPEEPKKADDAAEGEKEEAAIPQSASFKEESNVVAELEDPEKKALDELKQLVQAALANNEFTRPPPPAPKEEEKPAEKAEEPAAEAAKEEQPSAEPPKAEEAAAEVSKADEAAAEPPKAEETGAEPPKAEETAAEPPAKVEEVETKEVVKPPKPEEPAPAAAADPAVAVVVAVAEEKAVVVDEDGAKTVEAIAETVVSVAAVAEAAPAAAEAEGETKEGEKEPTAPAPPEEVFLWGVPLLGDEKSDTVLLKFLRARDFKVKEALAMLKNAVIWRKEFGIEGLLDEDLELPELEKVVFMHGHDNEGHPVCYNVYGEFQDKELYQKVFSDEEKKKKFLRWRIQFLEKGIRQQLDFTPSGVCSMVQVTDLRNSPVLVGGKEFRQATKKALSLLQDNYPEFVAKKVFINVPWWYLAYNRMISTVFTPRTRSKFVFAGPSKSSETLFKYIAPEQVPVQYGGLSKESDSDFTTSDAVTEVTVKPASKHSIEIPVSETCLLVWELRVLGWDVSYGAEFVPSAEDGYTVIVQKSRKFAPADEPYVKNSFKIGEPGKVVLTVDNTSSKKKKLLYRSKTKSATESV